MQTASKKVINGWAMYDWANSVYSLVITSTIFPAYYGSVTGDGKDNTIDYVNFLGGRFVNTSLYNYALAVAFLIVAVMSPILSSIADYKGNKKSFMNFFLTIGSIACACMFFFDKGHLNTGIITLVIACIGYWSSLVFYNSFLPEIAAPEDQDRVSAKGFAMGYIGSVILQIVCFLFVMKPEWFGIKDDYLPAKLSFLLVGIWWWAFGQFSLSRLPKSIPAGTENKKNIIVNGYIELGKVWRQLTSMPVLKRYLFSFFFYNMGVQTVMLAATLYGTDELQIPTANLIIAILIIQLIAIPGSYLISKLSTLIGNFKALMVCVIIWICCCIAAFYMPAKGINEFYLLATIVGFIMGGIQSLSRSTYSKLMPATKDTASFFSFYDVTEKIAIVIGMFSFGFITEITGSQRHSVLALAIFFIIGLIGLLWTRSVEKKITNETL
ncbi:MFS transporter [Ferruginibacter albus]|uniref:MFS transporter n=1 Tax=Ferruginibacter albus TaxID=2875540 RepID=UPI001CC74A44|nr:MFS transporter [Ferruginibacter albus]UAY51798.1 MFS transporter [Ferruginibacter albus]